MEAAGKAAMEVGAGGTGTGRERAAGVRAATMGAEAWVGGAVEVKVTGAEMGGRGAAREGAKEGPLAAEAGQHREVAAWWRRAPQRPRGAARVGGGVAP